MSASDSKLPLIASLFCTLLGLLIGVISGLKSGSMAGGIIAGLGMIPACYAMWLGIQDRDSQATMAKAVLLFLASAGVAGVLILLSIFNWLT